MSITLALLATTSSVNSASTTDTTNTLQATLGSSTKPTLLVSNPSASTLTTTTDLNANTQPIAPKHQYKLLRDSSNPKVLASLEGRSSIQQDRAFLETLTRPSKTIAPSYYFDIREVIPFKGIESSQTVFPYYNEGNLGACAANALAGAIQYRSILQGISNETPSRLFIYYNQRSLAGRDVTQDTGATISSAIAAFTTYGVCPESLYSYDSEGEKFAVKPNATCYEAASGSKGINGAVVANIPQNRNILSNIKKVLHEKCPIVMGINVYSSFESEETTKTGVVTLPNTLTEQLLGSRALMITGYNETKQQFTVRNSWGSTSGNKGDYYLPYSYITPDLAFDFWLVGKVSSKVPVTFSVTANTPHGQFVYVSGNAPELGNWDIKKALQLTCTAQTYPNWTGSAFLSAGQSTEFKFFKADKTLTQKPVWLDGQNLSHIPSSGGGAITHHWK
ncbi:carbohydrate-binding module family 20 domain-containing protein [Candidatus Finniella inopinata]|nr:carbohydrate-binding module family 20 domain-containing protein [Candidatus Finniella inopinata]